MSFADFFLKKNKIKAYGRFILLLIFFIICFMTSGYTDGVYSLTEASDAPDELMVCGDIVGIKIDMDGIMVLGLSGFDSDKGYVEPSKGKFKEGDYIMAAGGKKLDSKEDLTNIISASEGKPVEFVVKHEGKTFKTSASPEKGVDGIYRLGIWVRDSTQGLGTLTFYDNESRRFGALGHGITDVDTGRIMSVSGGELMKANVTAIVKGKKGSPGELIGELLYDKDIGGITDNNRVGVYGKTYVNFNGGKLYKVATGNEVKTGDAYILSGLSGKVEKYLIKIENINRFSTESSKSMTVRITDKRLLDKSGGIIQGMSGSPIIQNEKIVGALTHVFLNSPERGYGIFIGNML